MAEVLAWRIDAFLGDNPEPPQPAAISPEPALRTGDPVPAPACPAYESTAEARERLTALAAATLGGQLAGRAQSEVAWPALIAALRRAENAGYSPADALTHVATARELRTARSISEVLAWRINRHLAAHPAEMDSPVITADEVTAATATEPLTPEDSITLPGGQDRAQHGQAATAGSFTAPLLPWVPGPRQSPG